MGSRNAALPRALFFGKWVGRGPRACTSTPRTKTCPRGAPDLGLSFDARFAGWMVGPGRGFAACFFFGTGRFGIRGAEAPRSLRFDGCGGWRRGRRRYNRAPQACAWGYRLRPATRAGWWGVGAASPRALFFGTGWAGCGCRGVNPRALRLARLLFHHFNAPVLRATQLGVVAAHRMARAKSLSRQPARIHACRHQVRLH